MKEAESFERKTISAESHFICVKRLHGSTPFLPLLLCLRLQMMIDGREIKALLGFSPLSASLNTSIISTITQRRKKG